MPALRILASKRVTAQFSKEASGCSLKGNKMPNGHADDHELVTRLAKAGTICRVLSHFFVDNPPEPHGGVDDDEPTSRTCMICGKVERLQTHVTREWL